MTETILAISAHNDDHIIGAGGTLAKYALEGKRIITVICSLGEKSHPHIKPHVITKRRHAESIKADKIIGGHGVIDLNMREGHFPEDFKRTRAKLVSVITQENPSKIFTHGIEDAHPDHRAVFRMIMQLIDKKIITCPVYSFEIWSVIKLRNRNLPRLVVDISQTFKTKMKACLVHESQRLHISFLIWKLIVKDFISGKTNGYSYAEVFYRLT